MLPVWMVFPTRNTERAQKTAALWNAAGYKTFAICEPDMASVGATMGRVVNFRGYWIESNDVILSLVDQASCVVMAADDMEPDPTHKPEDIAREFYEKFPDGYGVMQPCGDDKNGMDGVWRICGSPWFGRAWILESHQGRGPCPYDYRHFYGDEALFNIAQAQGVLWQREDISQLHRHWCRNDDKKTHRLGYQRTNSDTWWDLDKSKYLSAVANGFPGSERKRA